MALPKILMISGAATAVISVIFGWFAFPFMVDMKIGKSVGLRKPNDMRNMWAKAPFPLNFKIYMFNVTNPTEAAEGATPIVQEVGPFIYDEWKEKVKLEDHPDTDTVSFNMLNKFIYNETLSHPLTGEEMVTIPHAALLSMVYTVEREKPGALGLLGKALPDVFNQPTTPFITAKVRDILFDGLPINCTSKAFAVAGICAQIRANPNGLKKVDDTLFLFSFFGMKNNTVDATRIEVKRGVTNPREVGLVVKINDKEKLPIWDGEPCNSPAGTDSTIFPPFLTPDDDIVAYSTDLCSSITAKFQKSVFFKGIAGLRYTADFGDMSTDPDRRCFCPTPTTCLKKGLMDLSKCAGAPIIASLPHLMGVHEEYQAMVRGLQPVTDKHEIAMIFEPMTATPLSARKRLQFNIFTHPVAKVPLTKTMCSALIPLFWVEEGVDLPDEIVNLLESSLFRTLRVAGVGRWLGAGLGLLLALAGLAVALYRRQARPVSPQPPPNKH